MTKRPIQAAAFLVAALAASTVFGDGGGQQRGPYGAMPPPPPVAIEACAGAAEGGDCAFIGRRGEQVVGTCDFLGDQIACVPEGGPPPAPRRGAMPESPN